MARPGLTKTATLGDGWQRLATLYDSDSTDAIKSIDGMQKANQVFLSIATNAGQIAFGLTMPTTAGHVLNVGDFDFMDNQEWIRSAWLRNNTAGSNAAIVITPIFGL